MAEPKLKDTQVAEDGVVYETAINAMLVGDEGVGQMVVPMPAPKFVTPINNETKKKERFEFSHYEKNITSGSKTAVYRGGKSLTNDRKAKKK